MIIQSRAVDAILRFHQPRRKTSLFKENKAKNLKQQLKKLVSHKNPNKNMVHKKELLFNH